MNILFVSELRGAIDKTDIDGYGVAYANLSEIHKRREIAVRRRDLLKKLDRRAGSDRPIANSWAAKIRGRIGVHGHSKLPGDPRLAWTWRQLHDELARRETVSIEDLSTDIQELRGTNSGRHSAADRAAGTGRPDPTDFRVAAAKHWSAGWISSDALDEDTEDGHPS